jgi:hypothetical protein
MPLMTAHYGLVRTTGPASQGAKPDADRFLSARTPARNDQLIWA